jgi:hypothetical protein
MGEWSIMFFLAARMAKRGEPEERGAGRVANALVKNEEPKMQL